MAMTQGVVLNPALAQLGFSLPFLPTVALHGTKTYSISFPRIDCWNAQKEQEIISSGGKSRIQWKHDNGFSSQHMWTEELEWFGCLLQH